jgi:hypothetical protein
MEVADPIARTATPLTAPPPVSAESCVNCGTPVGKHYCPDCGERRASDRDNHFWTFVKDAFHTVTNADGSFLRSLKLLFGRPGELTALHMRGRRVGLMRPLQLFLLVNVFYFLWAGMTSQATFATTLPNHIRGAWYSERAEALVNRKLEFPGAQGTYDDRFAAYRKRFDATTAVQAKSLIVAMVPAFAILAGLVHIRRRAFVAHHFVFALHVYAAFLALSIFVPLALMIPLGIGSKLSGIVMDNLPIVDELFGLTMLGTLFWYLRRAVQAAYGDGKRFATVAAAVLTAGVLVILWGYRGLLFLTAYWAT